MTPPLIKLDSILEGLQSSGFSVVDNALAEVCVSEILQYSEMLKPSDYKTAGVGQGVAQTHKDIRSDQIHWLDNKNPALVNYWQAMENLREAINRQFYLGLFDYECHLAQYQIGSFYQKHLDAFRGSSNRRLSCVYYLNDNWQSTDGGELVIYDGHGQLLETVLPQRNRLVVFFSEEFPHEVKPSNKLRLSLTGWFRVREQ